MKRQPIDWGHVRILTSAYVRNAVFASGGAVVLVLFVLVGLMISGAILDPVSEVHATYGKTAIDALTNELRDVVAWWIDADGAYDPRVVHLLKTKPAILSTILVVLVGFVPWLTCFAGANQLSRDTATKALRYLLLRTERTNVLLSRFFGVAIFITVTTFFLVAVITAYIGIKFDYHSFGDLFTWGLHGWAALVFTALPYLALCTLISSAVEVPSASLIACLSVGFVAFQLLKGFGHLFELMWFPRLGPWGWKYELLHPDIGMTIAAAGAMLGFTAIVLLLAARYFAWRDL